MKKSHFLKAMTDGVKMEGLSDDGVWHSLDEGQAFRLFGDCQSLVRIAPTLKPVDMSVLVSSGIDCEFGTSDNEWYPWSSPLVGEKECTYFPLGAPKRGIYAYSHCRPRQDYWHSLMNCETLMIKALEDAGFLININLNEAVQFNGLQPNRCYPWEAK